jgi:hypothetical protein
LVWSSSTAGSVLYIKSNEQDQALHPASLRALAALSASQNYRLQRWDSSVSVTLDVPDTKFCLPPRGHELPDVDGGKQLYQINGKFASKTSNNAAWRSSITSLLNNLEFKQLSSDKNLFHRATNRHGGEETIIIGVCNDYLCVAHSHEGRSSLYDTISEKILRRDDMKDSGHLTQLQDIEIDTTIPGHITMHQSAYIAALVEQHGNAADAGLSKAVTKLPSRTWSPALYRHHRPCRKST